MTIPAGPLRESVNNLKIYKNIFLNGNLENIEKLKVEILKINPNINIHIGKYEPLNLNEFSNMRFNDLARETGIRLLPRFKKRGLIIPRLTMVESSQRFYYGRLAVNMERLYNNSYRTLFLKNMQLVQLIDYKFDQDIEDTLDRNPGKITTN